MNTQKIAITIPKSLLSLIDSFSKKQGVSRSRYISILLQQKLEEEKNRFIKEAYDKVFADKSACQEQVVVAGGIGSGEPKS